MKERCKEREEKNKKIVEALSAELQTIRAGRANPAVLDKVRIDYYGESTAVSQLATISVSEARMLVIQPYDATTLKNIEKAIQSSDIGINPQNDGKVIRLAFPPLTEERRKELVKTIQKYGEEAKVSVRNVRRDAIDEFKNLKKKSEITEDDLKDGEKEMQNITDKYTKEIDAVISKKEKEIMEV